MVHAIKLNINGDPNIGMYCIATDRFCLLGRSVPDKLAKEIEEALKVPVIRTSIYGTPMVGIFIAATSKTVLLPTVVFENELKYLKDELAKINVEVKILETNNTALANNILCNDKVAIVSTEFSRAEVKKIESDLGVTVIQTDLGHMFTPGSAGVLTNKGAVFNPNLSEEEIKKVEKLLSFEIGLGTINMGSPIMHSGVAANSHGFLVGSLSSGFEIGRVDESLGFLNP